ncbi:MAG: HAD-IC family P-type ATPase, partial [Candidatus Competibacteraceae bacterium]|nr:HAD-IC family P-type ATPase [Candidatus Competibacteraceae bacterium]
GKLQIDEITSLGNLTSAQCLTLAAALEQRSEHPIAKALMRAAQTDNITLPPVTDSRAIPGQGVEGTLEGRRYRLGTPEFAAALATTAVPDKVLQVDNSRGASLIMLGDEQGVLALFRLVDEVRPQARAAIAGLQQLGITVEIASGDQPAAVERVAAMLGIQQYHGSMSPARKLERLQTLQEQGKIIAMVGDGVNDSPVLARAQVSIAMGSGTEIARSNADMVLLSERLDRLVDGVLVARRSLRIIRQNLAWALGYNVVAVPLAASGFIAPWMAAIGMSLSSLIVV